MIVLILDYIYTYDFLNGVGFELALPDLVGNSFTVELSKYSNICKKKDK